MTRSIADDDLTGSQGLIASWVRHLRAANLSPRTIRSYQDSAILLADFLAGRACPPSRQHHTRARTGIRQ